MRDERQFPRWLIVETEKIDKKFRFNIGEVKWLISDLLVLLYVPRVHPIGYDDFYPNLVGLLNELDRFLRASDEPAEYRFGVYDLLNDVGVEVEETLAFVRATQKIRDAAANYKYIPPSRGRPSGYLIGEVVALIADFWERQGKAFTRSTNKREASDFVKVVLDFIGLDVPFDRAMGKEIKKRKLRT